MVWMVEYAASVRKSVRRLTPDTRLIILVLAVAHRRDVYRS